jgi:sugar-specific transcriptional regulator TrmB
LAISSALMEKLGALGLTENECKAYIALLKLGACTAVQISRESHLQRTEIYPLMSELVSKGLVEETIDRPKRYRPVDVKHALPRLAMRIRDRLDRITKESEQLATKLEKFSTKGKQAARQEVRIIYGAQSARAHLLESIRTGDHEFWGISGRRRPPHISNRFVAEGLQLIASKRLKARLILEIDRENLKRVKKMTTAAEVGHYEPIPVYMYGVDDKFVAVSLAEEPISRPSQTAELVTSYRPTVRAMRQFFNILWRESTPFELREAILLGNLPSDSSSRVTRGREELFLQTKAEVDSAKESIRIYIPTRYGPVRLLKGLGETFMRARRRGAKIRLICRLLDDNARAVKTLAKFMEIRHTDNPIGFSMGRVDDSNAAIYSTNPDNTELESRTDYTIPITSKEGIRHLGNLFEALWEESIPIEGLLKKYEEPLGESSTPPS